jgi:2-polyprenyl-3-methyl-5-hydroxy-6-metoxy-1,4-benzoquinol methylase
VARKHIKIRNDIFSLYKSSIFDRLFFFLRSFVLDCTCIAEHIPLKAKVLDIGCGYGILSNYLALSDPDSYVKGIDIDASRIAKAVQTIGTRKNIDFEVGDFMNLDLGQFNVVVAIDLMHYFNYDQQDRIIDRIGNALSSSNLFIFRQPDTAPKWRYYWNYLHEFIMVGSTITKTNSQKLFFRSSRDTMFILNKAGFDVGIYPNKSILPYSDTLFVCKKR